MKKINTVVLFIILVIGTVQVLAESIPYSEIKQIKDKEGKEELKNMLLAYPQFHEYEKWDLTVDSGEQYPDGGIRTGFHFTLPADFSRYGIAYTGSLWAIFWDSVPEVKQPPGSAAELTDKINEFERLPQVQEFIKLYQPQSSYISSDSILLAAKNYIWGYHIGYDFDKKHIDTVVLNPNYQHDSFPQITQMVQGIRDFKEFPDGCVPFEGEIGYVEGQKGYISTKFSKAHDRMVYTFNTNYGDNCAEQYFVRIHNGVVEIQPERFEE